MCGIDVHMDPNIGKRLNALGNTLTSLTGEEDVDDIADLNSVNMADLSDEDEADSMSPTIHMVSEQWQLLLLPSPAVCHKNNMYPKPQLRKMSRLSRRKMVAVWM